MLCDDVLDIVFSWLCNPLEPRVAVSFSSASRGLRALTQLVRQQLKVEHEAASALCRKVGLQSCKQLREASVARWPRKGLTAADLATLGTLGSALPALQQLALFRNVAAPDGVQRLAGGLGAGGLPAVKVLNLNRMQMGDAGAAAIGAAIGRGALPRLEALGLGENGIGNVGVAALVPALRRLAALATLSLWLNPIGDEGVAALVRPPPAGGAAGAAAGAAAGGAAGGLTTLRMISLDSTQISDAGCATLTAALYSGAMPSLTELSMASIPGVDAVPAVHAALTSESRRSLLAASACASADGTAGKFT